MILLVIVFIVIAVVLLYSSSSCKKSENFEELEKPKKLGTTPDDCNNDFETCVLEITPSYTECVLECGDDDVCKDSCFSTYNSDYDTLCFYPHRECCYSSGGNIDSHEKCYLRPCTTTHNCCGDLDLPCKNFEHCDGTKCVLNPGRCYSGTDCTSGVCNASTNTCVDIPPYTSNCIQGFGSWHWGGGEYPNGQWVCQCQNPSVYNSNKGCSPLISDILCPQLTEGEVPADTIPSFSKYGWGNSHVLIEKGTEQNPLPTSIRCCNGNGKWNRSTQKCNCYVQTTPSYDDIYNHNIINAPIATFYGDDCEMDICTDPEPCHNYFNSDLPKSDACKLCVDTKPCLLPGEATRGRARVWYERNGSAIVDKYCCTTENDCETPPKKCEITHNCCGDLDLPCKNFEKCDGTKCVLNPGRCYISTDCPNGSDCDISTNTCVTGPPNYCNGNGTWNEATKKCDCFIQTTPNFDGTNPAIGTWYGDHCERDTNVCTNPEPCNDIRNYNLEKSAACSLCVENRSCLLPDKSTLGKIVHEIPSRIHHPDKYCCTTGTSC